MIPGVSASSGTEGVGKCADVGGLEVAEIPEGVGRVCRGMPRVRVKEDGAVTA